MHWVIWWYGPGHFGTERAELEARLQQLPGKQLVIVRYAPTHNVLDEWVYNAANLDSSKVIWAREMDESNNLDIIRYYKDRRIWLVEPDSCSSVENPSPVRLSEPYPANIEPAKHNE